MYNGYTINPSVELAYDPEQMTGWTWFWSVAWPRFWNSDVGKGLAIGLFALSIVATALMAGFTCWGAMAWVSFAIEMGSATVGFLVGAAICGFQSMSNGGSFWGEFASYVNNNWSQTLAITSVMIMASYAVAAAAGNVCFIAGTLVLCMDEDGNQCHKPIEDVKVGDMVWAYDEETGENAWKPVVRLFRNQTKEWYHVFVDGEEIVCTAEHPFYVVDMGFIPAKGLKAGDKLLLANGKQLQSTRLKLKTLPNLRTPSTSKLRISIRIMFLKVMFWCIILA